MNETTRTIPRIRLVARIAAVLCLLGAVALLPVMAYAAVVTTPNPTLPATAANDKVVTLSATDSASPGTSTTTFFKIDAGAYSTYAAGSGTVPNVPIFATLGAHTLSFYSVDGNGTEAVNTGTVTITDSLAPLTWAVSTGSWPNFDGSASFNLASTDNSFDYASGYGVTAIGSGVANTFYSLNGGSWTSGTAISSSVLGTNTVQFYSVDAAANKEATESATFWVKDNTPPVSSSDALAAYTGSATIHLSATGNAGGKIYYELDGTAGDAWNVYSAPIVVTAAGSHTLTFYAVDANGVNEAPHAATFTVLGADVTAPVTSYSGPGTGAVLVHGTVANIVLTAVDGGSGVAGLHYTVDGVANVQNGVRAANLFGAPNLGVPGSGHPGGTAAAITSGNLSCVAAGCHPTLAMPTAGAIDHTGVTSGCITCHSVVDAPTVVEPATHAAHDPSWACNLCHGTSLVAPVMPADNGGNHFLGSEPDHDGVCSDCHAFSIASSGLPSTASTITASFPVSGDGTHTIVYWAVDKSNNAESPHTVVFRIQTAAQNTPITTALTIGSSASSIKLGKAFNLTGLLNGTPGANGLTVTLMAKKPGKSFYSYSSARLTYGAGAASSLWQNNSYKPTAKGTYSFYVTFAGSGLYMAAPNSAVVSVTVK